MRSVEFAMASFRNFHIPLGDEAFEKHKVIKVNFVRKLK